MKIEYLDKAQAGAKAREFLAGASTPAEIAGRVFCLIAAARYADERCVARSNRSFSSLTVRTDVPWGEEVLDLIDDLCEQRLPEHLTATVREERREQRAAHEAHEAALTEARDRLDVVMSDVMGLTERQREQALADVDQVHGRYSVDGHRLRKQLQAPATDVDADDDAVAQAA